MQLSRKQKIVCFRHKIPKAKNRYSILFYFFTFMERCCWNLFEIFIIL